LSQISKRIAIFIVVLTFIIILGLFASALVDPKTQVDTKMPNMETPVQGKEIGGLFIEFEDGTNESEVKAILENCNIPVNYSINYNSDIMPSRYYIMVDKDKIMDIERLVDEINLTIPVKKGSNYVLTVTERAVQDKNFLAILEKNNIQVKKSIYCYVYLEDRYMSWNPDEDIPRIKDELRVNEKVLTVNQEMKVNDLFVEFENGTTESEVKAILENYNMTMNYSIDYNVDYFEDKYYMLVDKDKIMDVRYELNKGTNWTFPVFPDIKKENFYIITVTEQAIQDKNFLAMLEKNDLQVKKSVYCDIILRDGAKDSIWEIDALRIKNELERDKKILTVSTGGSTQ